MHNDVPPDAFKALDEQNLLTLMKFINSYCLEETNFTECQEGQLVLVPKSGDLSDPNKWRRVKLMDIGSKVFSSILCTRWFKIIRKHRGKYQFGSTPDAGCQDFSFTIKTMLHLQYNHNLPTFVIFADLVKSFYTSNHKWMVGILKKYGFPPKLCSTITRMYTGNKVRLILGNIDISIPFKVEVEQGYSVTPVLFLFIIMAFAETLEKEWVRNGLQIIKFKRQSNSPLYSGIINSHPTLQIHYHSR